MSHFDDYLQINAAKLARWCLECQVKHRRIIQDNQVVHMPSILTSQESFIIFPVTTRYQAQAVENLNKDYRDGKV